MRHLPFTAVFNFRDLGGYPTASGSATRWRTLYRADALHRFQRSESHAIEAIGLRTVIDLRGTSELDEKGLFPLADHPVRWEHAPMITSTWSQFERPTGTMATYEFLAARYVQMLSEGAGSMAFICEILADPGNVPAVFHCAAGKDRTGVVAAVLLSLAGVDDATIAADYALSTAPMVELRAWVTANVEGGQETMVNEPKAYYEAPEPVMRMFLDRLRADHGGARGYLLGVGASSDELDAVVKNLTA